MLPRVPPRFLGLITAPLPLIVDGGLHRWEVNAACCGKNGSRMELYAKRVEDGHLEIISSGRAGPMRRSVFVDGVLVVSPSLGWRIFARLVREGRAKVMA